MEKQKPTLENEQRLVLTQIKGTPFNHATNGEKNYITCGQVISETDKNIEETKKWIEEKPWEAIALLCEALFNEMKKVKNNNQN